jgi:16S rRNA (cytidine1402-2'-O)-methyltransferase
MSSRPPKPPAAAAPRLAESGLLPALPPGLYIVATPIGNLGDITVRALETLKSVCLVACEDTRVTGGLLHHFGIATRMIAYHEHNAEESRPRLLDAMRTQAVALVSDAGTPLISDPGYKLVRACVADGIPVTTLPGPSSVMAALTLAGLPTDRFFFGGFLPTKAGARKAVIADLARIPATLVLFESANRIADSLADLATGLGNREAALTRELTKKFEEARRGTLADLAASVATDPPRGEIVLVIAPPDAATPVTAADMDALLAAALARLSVRDAAAEVASITGIPKRDVYARALQLARPA